jgi:putative flippase GtrA
MRFPMFILYGIVAFNITAIALSMQTDFPVVWHASVIAKAIAWVIAVSAWVLAYRNRNRFFNLF